MGERIGGKGSDKRREKEMRGEGRRREIRGGKGGRGAKRRGRWMDIGKREKEKEEEG